MNYFLYSLSCLLLGGLAGFATAKLRQPVWVAIFVASIIGMALSLVYMKIVSTP
jgi:uncharacterized protein (DUF983 family)